MNEKKLVARLHRGDTAALAEIIEQYTPYVYAIVSNVLGGMLGEEDAEEITADVFTALWYNRLNAGSGALKAYIAAIARNKAKSRLRAMRISEPLQDDVPVADCTLPEEQYIVSELGEAALVGIVLLLDGHHFHFSHMGVVQEYLADEVLEIPLVKRAA